MSRAHAARLLALIAAFGLPTSVRAQQGAVDAMTALRDQWKGVAANVLAAARELTDAEYAYRPTKAVRSFGELVGHVAGTQNMICAAVLGDPPSAEDAIEKSATTKAQLVAAMEASNTYCARAYAISGAALSERVDLFGEKSTKVAALALNAVHDGEHYGNIVTYMRMQGKVPPSSKR